MAAVKPKISGRPPNVANQGPNTNATENDKPILTPTVAIAFIRCSSRVKSVKSAIIALAIAPAPCKARPNNIAQIESAVAATTLPIAKTIKPPIMRSEEHTSELQSRPHLVCRLLLEKKKKTAHKALHLFD